MTWTLTRKYLPKVTIGTLKDPDGVPRMLTLEEPWRNNERKISCIPEGVYTCVPHHGMKFNRVWHLQDVPGRTAILIHSGNSTADIEGCILVGGIISPAGSDLQISHSMDALNLLRKLIGVNNGFELTIKAG